MDKVYVLRTACRASVPVRPDGDGYVTLSACNGCDVPAGSSIAVLFEHCQTCQKEPVMPPIRVIPTRELPILPSVITAKPPGAVQSPQPAVDPAASCPPSATAMPELDGVSMAETSNGPVPVLAEQQVPSPPPVLPVLPVQSQPVVHAPAPVAQEASAQAQVLTSGAVFTPAANMAQAGVAEAFSSTSSLLADIFSLGGEEAIDINAVLAKVPGLSGGPSQGGFSWHTLELPMKCWRLAYNSLVLGLVPKKSQYALAFGTLYHACLEIWYKSGGQRRYDEPCDAVRQAGAPKLAGAVQRLIYAELMKYAQEEATTWDIRAVEQNAIFWDEPQRINGKLVYIPYSCRHDMLIAKRQPGAACAPPGPVASGIYVVDHKTASALTYDLTKGYAMDGQFLMNALVYKRSTEEREFGPFVGMLFAVAVKHKDPSPEKSFFRIETTVDDASLAEFHQHEIRLYATELYRRLSTPDIRNDPRQWPKCRASCVDRHGICRYFDICDVGGDGLIDAMFTVDQSRILDVEKLAPPPAEVKRELRSTDPVKAESDVRKKGKADERRHMAAQVLEAFRAAALALDDFDPARFLVPNHTRKTVLDQLVTTLRGIWALGAHFPFGPDAEGRNYELTIGEKGIGWLWSESDAVESVEEPKKRGRGRPRTKVRQVKGTMTYLAIAESICRDWWDPKHLEAK